MMRFPRCRFRRVHDGQVFCIAVGMGRSDGLIHMPVRMESFKDAIALELCSRYRRSLFLGMGASSTPIDLWMWDADRGSAGRVILKRSIRVWSWMCIRLPKAVDTAEFARPGDENLPATGDLAAPDGRSHDRPGNVQAASEGL